MRENIEKTLITKEQLSEMVKELGRAISNDYADKSLVLVGVMKGSLIFMADLLREITIPVEFGTITASSYGASTVSSGEVKIVHDVDVDIENKDILLVEDLIDTGHTLKFLQNFLSLRGPRTVKICVAFDKPSRREKYVKIDYKGMDIPDEFIVGYGLDFNEKYRNLSEVCVLKPEAYCK